jgi:hypothetical protein
LRPERNPGPGVRGQGSGVRGRKRRGARLPRVRCLLLAAGCLLFLVVGCRQQMADQPPHKPLGVSTFFDHEQAARPLVPGTVAQGALRSDEGFETGKVGDRPVETLPFPLTREVLERGRARFEIFCTPCHDRTGSGQGMVVRRGFRQPPSYHIPRLREAPLGHFVDVMTHGIGIMPDYAAQVPARDRWAIAAYIRALQLSEWATLADVPAAERAKLQGGTP